MRLRKKWWARPELESSYLFINDPGSLKGKWKKEFNNNNSIYLELGCGRGGFISQAAQKYEDKNFLGIDLKDEVLIYALKKIEESQVENARITALNIAFVSDLFNNNDNIERIYINFCNPWPKDRHNKRRLTHPKFLTYYKTFIKKGTQIWFKTDDEGLFMDSIDYFNESGFRIKYLTYDLANSGFEENIITEYENKFRNLGMNIMFLIAELE